MKTKIIKLIYYFQIPIFLCSYLFFKMLGIKNKEKLSWVVGVSEISNNINFLREILKPSVSVVLDRNKFYNSIFDYTIPNLNIYLHFIIRILYGPLLLGYLANKHTHFWYMWNSGFLLDREFEFIFLKSINKKIVCMFLGDDIRSIKLIQEYGKKNNIDVWGNYNFVVNDRYEFKQKKTAIIADKYADIVISFKIDQVSYLESNQNSLIYFYPNDKFDKNISKFKQLYKIKVLHSPTSPINKGTPIVRAAIKKLEVEGYNFEYVELQNMPNEVVLEHLRTSHIVLNQFYLFVPGVFGIESMANNCAVLMSADPSIETGLPQDSKDAWLITKYWEVYDNLKYLLDNPDKIKYYADRGYDFAYKHYTYEAASEYINKVLKENGVIE